MFDKISKLTDAFYAGNYKRYILLPLALFPVLAFIAFVFPGLEKGIDVRGGTLIIVRTDKPIDIAALENTLSEFDLTELKVVPFQGGVQIQFAANKKLDEVANLLALAKESQPEERLRLCREVFAKLDDFLPEVPEIPEEPDTCIRKALEAFSEAENSFRTKLDDAIIKTLNLSEKEKEKIQHTVVSPTLGKLFWEHALRVFFIAAVLIIIVVFLFFREVIPSLAIIAAASFDILSALAFMAIFKIPFSLTAISALLMLVGYSVDTDIMLTTRIFKRAGTLRESASASLRTGLTMTGTTLVAVTIMAILSSLWRIEIIFNISSVLLFGLIGDLISTWFMNAPLLMWYMERKSKR